MTRRAASSLDLRRSARRSHIIPAGGSDSWSAAARVPYRSSRIFILIARTHSIARILHQAPGETRAAAADRGAPPHQRARSRAHRSSGSRAAAALYNRCSLGSFGSRAARAHLGSSGSNAVPPPGIQRTLHRDPLDHRARAHRGSSGCRAAAAPSTWRAAAALVCSRCLNARARIACLGCGV